MTAQTDRELLTLAAKAAGLTVLRSRLDDPMWRDLLIDKRPDYPQTAGWNALTDDGDALRLAVRLGLTVSRDQYDGEFYSEAVAPGTHQGYDEPHNGDPYAATRRAIVRAAASLAASTPPAPPSQQ